MNDFIQVQDNNLSDDLRLRLFERINSISTLFKLNYPINPKCQYAYPPANQTILQNITNALVSNQKFYYQTLHLMNKMSLPCPFVPNVYTSDPQRPFEVCIKVNNNTFDITNEEPMNVVGDSTSSESEIESTSTSDRDMASPIQRLTIAKPGPSKTKKIKVESFLKRTGRESAHGSQPTTNVDEIFEKITIDKQKPKKVKDLPAKDGANIEQIRVLTKNSECGFGKLLAANKRTMVSGVAIDETPAKSDALTSEFISKEELDKNRLKTDELQELSAFKNYERGDVSTRIYIKNISKKADEAHLRRIYGRYIDFEDDVHANAFDIRLMTEGRMKGQAFVTLPNEKIAQQALDETNGYMLLDKAIVVQFARSAKSK